jgi:hypothetical protein
VPESGDSNLFRLIGIGDEEAEAEMSSVAEMIVGVTYYDN